MTRTRQEQLVPSAATPVRWGILGTGSIARSFARDLALLPDAPVVAVGSRSTDGAEDFAAYLTAETGARIDPTRRHGSYEQLAADDGVDAVYVATPQSDHHASTTLALAAGRAVLLEKPFTLNAGEAESLVSLARERGVFLMEAMWTRFLPHMLRLREILDDGELGELVSVVADHGQWFDPDRPHRLLAPELGGGALLDLGIYPVSFASWVLGEPQRVTAVGTTTDTGVDAQTSILLEHAGGRHAVLTTTLQAATANRAVVNGTAARVEIDRTWYAPSMFTVVSRDGAVLERYDTPHGPGGLRHEAAEVARCLAAGERESPRMPLAETVAIMRTLDEVRRQTGLVYPGEPASASGVDR